MNKNHYRNLVPVLSSTNFHERDKYISFEEEGHKYTISSDPNSKYTSVTTWNHSHFPHFDADKIIANMMKSKNWKEGHKYWGLTPQEIKKQWSDNGSSVSGSGTKMHYNIECFMNNPTLQAGYNHQSLYIDFMDNINSNEELKEPDYETKEWKQFMQYIQDNLNLKPYRTEWLIYHDDLKLSGSIDMVYENEDGTLMIYDWKRSKNISAVNSFNKYAITDCISHMPDSNFWHYSLQLNTYKGILERKYNKKIVALKLVRFHPESESYEILNVPDLSKDIEKLFELRLEEIKNKK